MHAFIYLFNNVTARCSHHHLYTRISYVSNIMRHLHPHTLGDTPESFRPHTNFGMAVGSMQTWNLSWLFTNIEYFFIHYYSWSVWDNPSTILPRGLQGPRRSLTLRHWRYCGGSPLPLLQSRDKSCIIAKKSTLWAFIKQSELCCELLS